jgi:CHASE2 domain-containing sensor protein/predicted Ser/Thr protein kinase
MRKYSSYILYLLITLFVAILSLNGFGPLEHLQLSINDFLCRITAPNSPRPNIVVVAIDWRAQDEYGKWPWNHDIIADLLAAIGGAEPKAIAVNLDLSEDAAQNSAGHTSILAGQLSWINNAVLSYDIALATFRSGKTGNPEYLFNNSVTVDNPLGLMEESSTPQVRKVFLPAEKLLANKPFLGFDYTTPDEDRVLRHQPLIMNYEGYYYPSLSLLAAAVYLGVTPSQIKVEEKQEIQLGSRRKIPINDKSEYFISFPKGQAFTTYSAAEVLGENFNFSRLKDKLVVVGVPDGPQQETFRTPVNSGMAELFIKAAVMENIINDNVLLLKNDQPLLNLLIILIIGAVCAFVLPQVSTVNRMIILGVGFIILVNVNYFLFSSFKIIPETVYIAFELVLLMIASPFIDLGLIANIAAGKRDKETVLPKVEIERKPHLPEQTVKPREIKSTAFDPENQATEVFEAEEQYPEDYQAIRLDEDSTTATATPDAGISVDKEEEVAVAGAKQVSPQPEIVSPDTSSQPPESLDWQPDDAAADSQPEGNKMPPIGDIRNLGRYQVTSVLGKGAMGMVYKGVDPAINRPVALKTIRLDFVTDPQEENELKERLHREAQAAGKLSHPNIVTIYDVGSEGHLQYIAMEFLEGQTLEEMIKKKVKFNYRIIAQIIIQICNALDYGHAQGIVHRDIKPANVMILRDYRVKVMDYGIARVDSSSMTKTGIAMGTPNYISPEQLQGKKVDHRADLFSLGVVMYEMLLGRRPFKGENLTSLIYAIINNEPEKPSDVNPQIPLLFDHIIARSLKKDANERYQHAKEIATHLADFVESFAVKT